MINVLIPKEIIADEKRVAGVPDTVKRIVKAGAGVVVESGAGRGAFISDEKYREAGAVIDSDTEKIWADADVILKVRHPVADDGTGKHETEMMKEDSVLIATLLPYANPGVVRRLLGNKITSFSMDFIPRISRAQKMDSLSSQSNIAGYKAVLIAANELGRYFPMLMTAAGTIKPAKVVVIGAGVAGLQAVATARRLGAVVEVSDIRPAVKEQVRSLGAKYIEVESDENLEGAGGYAKEASADFLRKQKELLHKHVAAADVVICTALVTGKKAPVIIDAAMVRDMKPGSVVVDLAAEQGGNCELSEPGRDIIDGDVKIIGRLNVPGSMAEHASFVYSKNILNFFMELLTDGELDINLEDEVIRGALITHKGELMQKALEDVIESGGGDK